MKNAGNARPSSLGGQYEQEILLARAEYSNNLWVYVLKGNTKLPPFIKKTHASLGFPDNPSPLEGEESFKLPFEDYVKVYFIKG